MLFAEVEAELDPSMMTFFVTTTTMGRFGVRDKGRGDVVAASAAGLGEIPNSAHGAKKLMVPSAHAHTRT